MSVITYLTKTKSRKEGLVLARGSKDTVHSDGEGRTEACDTAGHVGSTFRKQRDECCSSANFLL